MKFVDEVKLKVKAGNGGNGSASFRREKCAPFGGPDGGDGGKGGDIVLESTAHLNTLIDFRHISEILAESGDIGRGQHRTGRSGEDRIIKVPCGTVITDVDTEEVLGDLLSEGQRLIVAKGGDGGLGNLNFKSSTNRSPRKFTPGYPGEERYLKLELRLLADVGLLGLPNAGKSTLLRAVSAAKPKVADYPFTTLYPHLGVVSVFAGESFVMADIPGLIEGASEGAGLGHQFLRHLSRTCLLLHLVSLSPVDGDPLAQVLQIEKELKEYSQELADKDRWLIFSKADTLLPDEVESATEAALKALEWKGPVFIISAVTGEGLEPLKKAILESIKKPA